MYAPYVLLASTSLDPSAGGSGRTFSTQTPVHDSPKRQYTQKKSKWHPNRNNTVLLGTSEIGEEKKENSDENCFSAQITITDKLKLAPSRKTSADFRKGGKRRGKGFGNKGQTKAGRIFFHPGSLKENRFEIHCGAACRSIFGGFFLPLHTPCI